MASKQADSSIAPSLDYGRSWNRGTSSEALFIIIMQIERSWVELIRMVDPMVKGQAMGCSIQAVHSPDPA